MDKIEPCPICGNAAVHHTNVSSHNREDWSYYVSCIRDHCLFAPIAKTQDDAIAVWNRLSRAARLLAAVEGLALGIQPANTLAIRYEQDRFIAHLKNAPSNRGLLFGRPTLVDALIALGEATNG